MILQVNLPYSLTLLVGKRYHDTCADETNEIHVGSETEPVRLGRLTLPDGRRVDYWIITQGGISLTLAHLNGPPFGIERGRSYYQRVAVCRHCMQ